MLKKLKSCFLFKIIFKRRQKEIEKSLMEIEMNKKVEELVTQRIESEIKRREEIIETEVKKRLAEARLKMEKELNDEFEKQKQIEYKKQLEKEVIFCASLSHILTPTPLLFLLKNKKLLATFSSSKNSFII
jgi:23S rRNA C2498 (ribose-2'-O)-methylase RlmM